jgi:IS4 transposase
LYPSKGSRAEQHANALAVRVIEYSLPGADGANTRYRLITTLMDPQAAPALELAALNHQRWQVESVFDELKTHQLKRTVLRPGPIFVLDPIFV